MPRCRTVDIWVSRCYHCRLRCLEGLLVFALGRRVGFAAGWRRWRVESGRRVGRVVLVAARSLQGLVVVGGLKGGAAEATWFLRRHSSVEDPWMNVKVVVRLLVV